MFSSRNHVAASAPPSIVTSSDEEAWGLPLTAKPPTSTQLASLTSLPSGLYSTMSEKGKKGAGRKKVSGRSRLAREAQIISRIFDAMGNRPQPNNGLNLEQSVQIELTVANRGFLRTASTAGVPVYASSRFSLSDFAAASTLATVFDQYRIDQLEVWLEADASGSNGLWPIVYTTVDLDDANIPTSLGQVSDRLGSIVCTGPAGHYHKWKPHVAVATFSGAFTSYANTPACWIDTASPSVQHFGLKIAAVSGGTVLDFNLNVRAVITLRSPSIA